MPAEKRVLIVDDHPLFRDALEAAFLQLSGTPTTITKAASLQQALAFLDTEAADLILLDLSLSDASGFDGMTRLLVRPDPCPVYIVSALEQPEAFSRARALGAAGYFPKSLAMEDLRAALATALDGGEWFPESLAPDTPDESAQRLASLTPAQFRVLNGLAEGLLNKQIAYEMGISVATVKAHMTAILRKLGASNRTQALLIYKEAVATLATN